MPLEHLFLCLLDGPLIGRLNAVLLQLGLSFLAQLALGFRPKLLALLLVKT